MRRNYNIERALGWQFWKVYEKTPKFVIPPKSVIRLIKTGPHWDEDLTVGASFRIGYYSKMDGPNCVWLVDARGCYERTWDQKSLLDYFEIVSLSHEADIYGAHRTTIGPL